MVRLTSTLMLRLLLIVVPCSQVALAQKRAPRPVHYLKGDSPELRRALEQVALARIQTILNRRAPNRSAEAARNLAAARKLLSKKPSRRGFFVSIFDSRTRRLVGCMGTLAPVRSTLLQEVEHWTYVALLQDPRLKRPLPPANRLVLILSLIERVEPVRHPLLVDPIRHGLLIRTPSSQALVLPGEAYTADYAFRMTLAKLSLTRAQARARSLRLFRVHAVRFGGAKRLFQTRGTQTRPYGG